MNPRVKTTTFILAALLLIALAACDDAPSYTGYLTEAIPPCKPVADSSVDPCEPDVTIPSNISGGMGSISYYDKPTTVRQSLEGGSIAHIPHIVLRGTYIPETVRCIKDIPMRTPSYAEPSYFQHSIRILCYSDVRVNDYILGDGPPRLAVQVAFINYWKGYFTQDLAAFGFTTEQEAIEYLRTGEEFLLKEGPYGSGGIGGREVVLFIGPARSPSHEVWQVFAMWDVQRLEDGAVVAVHPFRDEWKMARPGDYQEYRTALEIEMPRFAQEVVAAQQARVSEYGGRIAPADIQSRAEGVELPMLITDVHNLDEYLANTGAYDHPDGTPLPPPPVPGEGDPISDIGIDDSTPGPSPTPPGGEEDSTPAVP